MNTKEAILLLAETMVERGGVGKKKKKKKKSHLSTLSIVFMMAVLSVAVHRTHCSQVFSDVI